MKTMKSVFGGIWKDGAVEPPPSSVITNRLTVLDKSTNQVHTMDHSVFVLQYGSSSSRYWWLDRRVPERLSPREAFDLMKVLSPGILGLEKTLDSTWRCNGHMDRTPIEWGSAESYAPPPEEKWIDATLENWKSFLLKRCQFFEDISQTWVDGVLVGMNLSGYWLVECNTPRCSPPLAYVSAINGKLQFLVEATDNALPTAG